MFEILETLALIQNRIFSFWWLWSFLLLFFLARSLWLAYAQEYYKRSVTWTMLEIKIPREVRKSPRAMEQVFTAVHAIKNNPSSVKEKWWDGEVTLWFSFEMVSFGGEIHFYLRIPAKHRNMIESALYANYTDIEISEVAEDYTSRMPDNYRELEKTGFKLFGNELALAKHDAYPIRTYIDFEDNEEERQLDPIAALLETMVKIKPQEIIWLQIVVRPVADDSWKEDCQKLIKELKEKVRTEFMTATGKITFTERSPGEMEVLKAIERCIAKPGFKTTIRYLYMAPDKIYDGNFGQRGVYAALNQYMSESLNKFRHNVKAWTRASFWYWPHLFPKRREYARKVRIYENYRKRKIPDDIFTSKILEMKAFHWGIGAQQERVVLNTEELATIYHLPTMAVLTGPLIKRVEAKKAGPPAGLPIYGEEGESGDLPGINK